MKVGQTGSEKNSPGKKTLLGPYAQSKYLAEEYVQTLIATGFPATIIRPTAVIGPGDINLTPPGELIRSSLGGKLKIYFNAFINVIDSRDVAHAAVEALFTEPGKTYIAGSHNVEIAEIIRRISRTTEKKRMPLKLPYFAAYFGTALLELAGLLTNRTPAFTTRDLAIIKHPWTFDSSKATRELGLTSRPLQTTIDDAVNWHRRKIWMNS
jgi:dihydroflavonol-4-reductase